MSQGSRLDHADEPRFIDNASVCIDDHPVISDEPPDCCRIVGGNCCVNSCSNVDNSSCTSLLLTPVHKQAPEACHPFDGDDALASGVIRRKWGARAAETLACASVPQ